MILKTHSYPMTWSDLVIMVEGINGRTNRERKATIGSRLLKRHWQISVNKVVFMNSPYK